LISYEEKKNLTTTFIQLLRTKKFKNKIKNEYSEKKWERKKKSYLNVVASEAENRKKNKFIKYNNLKKNWEDKRKKEKKTYLSMEEKRSWGEKRREEKERDVIFLQMGKKKKKKKGGSSVVKLVILGVLLWRFTDE